MKDYKNNTWFYLKNTEFIVVNMANFLTIPRCVIQRDLDRLERWWCSSARTCTSNPKQKFRLGGEWTETNPKRAWGCWLAKSSRRLNIALWAASKTSMAGRSRGGFCLSVLSLSHPGVLHLPPEPLTQERHGLVPRGEALSQSQERSTSHDRMREMGLFIQAKRRLWGDLTELFCNLR